MIQTEKAFDMLPYVADIYEKLKLKDYIKKNFIKAKKDEKVDEIKIEAGLNITVYIFKNSPKIKYEIFNIVALAHNKTVDEVKKQSLTLTIKAFKEIFENDELVSFFKSAMQ